MEMENVIPTKNKARETLFSLFLGKRMLFIVILFAISLIIYHSRQTNKQCIQKGVLFIY